MIHGDPLRSAQGDVVILLIEKNNAYFVFLEKRIERKTT